jgi:hypothetical protein
LQSETARPNAEEHAVATIAESNGRNGKPSRKRTPVKN